MAPKSKKGASAQKSKGAEDEREEPLQAVVFADSFETKFAPFALERPRVRIKRQGQTTPTLMLIQVSAPVGKYTPYRIHIRVSGERRR